MDANADLVASFAVIAVTLQLSRSVSVVHGVFEVITQFE
jgi:hypothetical protein